MANGCNYRYENRFESGILMAHLRVVGVNKVEVVEIMQYIALL